jgi:hypothetical protein
MILFNLLFPELIYEHEYNFRNDVALMAVEVSW